MKPIPQPRNKREFRIEFENFPPMAVSAYNKGHAMAIAGATIQGEKITRVVQLSVRESTTRQGLI